TFDGSHLPHCLGFLARLASFRSCELSALLCRAMPQGFPVTRIDTTTAADVPFRSDDVFAAVGEAPYEWRIDSDALAWGPNAVDVSKSPNATLTATGPASPKRVDPENGHTRSEAIMRTPPADKGAGVAYQVQYGLRPKPGTDPKLWIEDVGRWFAGADGKP